MTCENCRLYDLETKKCYKEALDGEEVSIEQAKGCPNIWYCACPKVYTPT